MVRMTDYGTFMLLIDGELDDERVAALVEATDAPVIYSNDMPEYQPRVLFVPDGDQGFESALRDAIARVEQVDGVRAVGVDTSDQLTLRQVARRLKRSRLRPKRLLEEVGFPQPTHEGEFGPTDTPYWEWADVAAWAGDDGPRQRRELAQRVLAEHTG